MSENKDQYVGLRVSHKTKNIQQAMAYIGRMNEHKRKSPITEKIERDEWRIAKNFGVLK